MRIYLNKFLLGTLLTLSLLLAASFWFDTKFEFNIFAKNHWRYLAATQTGPDPVMWSFYISLIIFTLALPLGLYLIARPNRRIKSSEFKVQSSDNNEKKLNSELYNLNSTPMAPAASAAPVRPPLLMVPAHLQIKSEERRAKNEDNKVEIEKLKIETKNNSELSASNSPSPSALRPSNSVKPSLESVEKIQKIISGAGYTAKNGPNIGDLKPDVWAVGTDEVLLIGTVCPAHGDITVAEGGASKWKSSIDGEFESPVYALAGAVQKLRALFLETLDEDIKISIRAFVIIDNGKIANRDQVDAIWKAFDIEVFDSAESFAEYMSENANRELPESEKEDFDAYAEYIDTVGEYFNSKG